MLFSNITHPRHFNFQIPQLSLNPKLVGYGSFCAIHMQKIKKPDSSPKSTGSGKKTPLNLTTRSSISMQTRWATSTSGIMLML